MLTSGNTHQDTNYDAQSHPHHIIKGLHHVYLQTPRLIELAVRGNCWKYKWQRSLKVSIFIFLNSRANGNLVHAAVSSSKHEGMLVLLCVQGRLLPLWGSCVADLLLMIKVWIDWVTRWVNGWITTHSWRVKTVCLSFLQHTIYLFSSNQSLHVIFILVFLRVIIQRLFNTN